MHTFFIATLGCKVNQYESDAIASRLTSMGWIRTAKAKEASLLLINTCTVTGNASTQSRHMIRQLIRQSPQATVMVTGCYAQTEGDVIAAIEGVDHVIGHTDKHRIPELIAQAADQNPIPYPACHGEDACRETVFQDIPAPPSSGNRTRPFLKIQDGCNSFCTYCIVPYTRGRSRSLPVQDVMEKVRALSEQGFCEVVLTGIHVGMYGLDLNPKTDFTSLLDRLSRENGPRLRLGSVEPREVTDDLIALAGKRNRIVPHFHIPLQSGDDTILSRMHRPYDRSFFADRVHAVRSAFPLAAIGSDVMIGFPGETESLFENTFALIQDLPLTYLHVFPYSPRPGTPAATYPDPVAKEVAKERCARLRKLAEKKRLDFARKLCGTTAQVLIEQKRDRKTGLLKGLSGNYQTVYLEGPDTLKNKVVSAMIQSVTEEGALMGEHLA